MSHTISSIKFFVIGLLLVFSCSKSYGQLKLQEMKTLRTMNISSAEDFLISKGYKFKQQSTDPLGCEDYEFAKNQVQYGTDADAFVIYTKCANSTKIYQSISDEKFIPKIKSEAISLGMKYTNTEKTHNGILHIYEDTKYILKILSYYSANNGMSLYEISFGLK
jgi:hypothetical protein